MDRILVNGAISVFLLLLIIFGNFLGGLLPCRVQTLTHDNMLMKHFLGFLTLVFFSAITIFKDNRIDVIFYCIILYLVFLVLSKTGVKYFTTTIFLIGLVYFMEIYGSELNDKLVLFSSKGQELNIFEKYVLKNYQYLQTSLIVLCIPIILFGFITYLGNKKREYKEKFSFIDFFLGKPECKNVSPPDNVMKDIENLKLFFN